MKPYRVISGLSKFLKNANPPAIVPAVKSGFDVRVSNTFTNSVRALVPVIIKSLFAKLLTNDVHAFDNFARLPYFIQQSSLDFASYDYETS